MARLQAWQGLRVAAVAWACLHGGAHAAPGAPSGHLRGLAVHAVSGQAIAGARILAGTQATTTDAQGRFDLVVEAAAGQTVRAIHAGYADGLVRVEVNANRTTLVTLPLSPVGATGRGQKGEPIVWRVPGSAAQLSVPAGGLPADVRVSLTAIDPASRPAALPGAYLQGVGASTQAIESFGALRADMRDSTTGQARDLAPGAQAVVRIPVSRHDGTLPETAPLSRLDEASGLWTQQGWAKLSGHGASLYYEGQIAHLGYWAVNRLVPTIQVHGSVCLPEGADAVNVRTDDTVRAVAPLVQILPNGSFHVAMLAGGQAALQAHSETQASEPILLGPSATDIELPACLPLSDL